MESISRFHRIIHKILTFLFSCRILFPLNQIHHCTLLIFNMYPDNIRRLLSLIMYDVFVHPGMLPDDLTVLAHILDVLKAVAIHLLTQVIYELHQSVIAGSCHDRIVKLDISLCDR